MEPSLSEESGILKDYDLCQLPPTNPPQAYSVSTAFAGATSTAGAPNDVLVTLENASDFGEDDDWAELCEGEYRPISDRAIWGHEHNAPEWYKAARSARSARSGAPGTPLVFATPTRVDRNPSSDGSTPPPPPPPLLPPAAIANSNKESAPVEEDSPDKAVKSIPAGSGKVGKPPLIPRLHLAKLARVPVATLSPTPQFLPSSAPSTAASPTPSPTPSLKSPESSSQTQGMDREQTLSSECALPPPPLPSAIVAPGAYQDPPSNESIHSDRLHLSIRLMENQNKRDNSNPSSVEVVVISSGRLPVPPLSGRDRPSPPPPATASPAGPAVASPPPVPRSDSEAAAPPSAKAAPPVVQPAAPNPPPPASSSVAMPAYLRQFVADVLSPRSVDNLFRLSMEDRLSALNILYKAYEESCKKFQFS